MFALAENECYIVYIWWCKLFNKGLSEAVIEIGPYQ